MKQLIVNGDDLGLSPGVNRGIVEAFSRGILTSASLIVNSPWSEDAAQRIRDVPGISIGLHVNLGDGTNDVARELLTQSALFEELVGDHPAHIDSHHDDHRRLEVLPHFLAFAESAGVPLRGHSFIHSVTCFYGRWEGASHPEQIGVDGLIRVLRQTGDGATELACHPGYVDAELRSSYSAEREIELATLCDPRVRDALSDLHIELVGSREVSGASARP